MTDKLSQLNLLEKKLEDCTKALIKLDKTREKLLKDASALSDSELEQKLTKSEKDYTLLYSHLLKLEKQINSLAPKN